MNTDLESINVTSSELPTRVITALKRAQIGSFGQIDRMSDADLTSLHGIGAVTARFIRATIAQLREGTLRSAPGVPFPTARGLVA